MYKLRHRAHFEAGHHLLWHERCKEPHGHTYHVEVVVGAHRLDENGIVMDLGALKTLCQGILVNVDHTNLNDKFDNPTVEIVAEWLYSMLVLGLTTLSGCEHVSVVEVTVWETPDGGVTYDGEDERVR